jgi:hypothetical protein
MWKCCVAPTVSIRGALALGGAVDYVSHTGYDAPKLQVRYATGSHGYQQRQVSSGQVLGDFDYYVSMTDSNADGYQDHTASESQGVIANFGYRFNPNLETRFYLRYRQTDNDLAGRVTKHSVEHDPRAANPAYVTRDDSREQPGSTFIGNKTTYYIDDDSSIQTGLVYHDYPMDSARRAEPPESGVHGCQRHVRLQAPRHALGPGKSQSTRGLARDQAPAQRRRQRAGAHSRPATRRVTRRARTCATSPIRVRTPCCMWAMIWRSPTICG